MEFVLEIDDAVIYPQGLFGHVLVAVLNRLTYALSVLILGFGFRVKSASPPLAPIFSIYVYELLSVLVS